MGEIHTLNDKKNREEILWKMQSLEIKLYLKFCVKMNANILHGVKHDNFLPVSWTLKIFSK